MTEEDRISSLDSAYYEGYDAARGLLDNPNLGEGSLNPYTDVDLGLAESWLRGFEAGMDEDMGDDFNELEDFDDHFDDFETFSHYDYLDDTYYSEYN